MSYATAAHVQALTAARGTYTATSIPNASQVQVFLDDAAAEIDTLLSGRGFTLPVPTGATIALQLLSGYNARIAWPMVERSAQNAPDARVKSAEQAADAARKMLASIEPPGLVRDTTTTSARSNADASAMFYTSDLDLQL